MGYARLLDHTVHDLYVWMSESVGWGVSKKGREEKFHMMIVYTYKSILVALIPSGTSKSDLKVCLLSGEGGSTRIWAHSTQAMVRQAFFIGWKEREETIVSSRESSAYCDCARVVLPCKRTDVISDWFTLAP